MRSSILKFWVCGPLLLTLHTVLGSRALALLYLAWLNLCTHWTARPFPAPHQSVAATVLLPTSMNLSTLATLFREGNGKPLQSSCLENPMDGGAWWAAAHGVTTSRTWLSAFTFSFYFHALEKEMAPHSSTLAWRIPGTGEPGGLPSLGSHRVGHDWSDLAAAAAATLLYKWGHALFVFLCLAYFP